jgi:hypothetical protein
MRRGLAEECGLDEGAPLGYPAIWNPASIRRGVYGRGSLLALFLLHRRSGSNPGKQPHRLAAQKHDAALWLHVNAFIHSCVFLLPTSFIHEKPP